MVHLQLVPLESLLKELVSYKQALQQGSQIAVSERMLILNHEQTEVSEPPKLSLSSTHTGTYLLAMLDLSVEPNNNPAGTNTTLIHWILPGLSSPNETTTTLTSQENAPVPYFPPGPPAGQTHTYALFLYQEPADFSIPSEYVPFFENITASVYNRVGFNLTEFVDKTYLGSLVAADWFLVSNTTSNAASSPSGATPTASSTGAMASSSSNSGSTVIKADTIFMVMALGVAGNLLKLL